VDVGTGTGAIALSIKDERPDATVFAIDRSVEAVALARSNAERLGLDVDVREGDMLSPLPADLRGTIDVVVSNPPYVSEGEFEELPDDVRADPASALFGALDVYKRLVADSLTWLKPDGVLAVEIDSRRGEDVQGVFVQCRLTNVQTFKDMNGLDRVVSGRRP
jgi:release factor glutamine methyltransferase